jgi:ANTAR domain-containing protein/GAF domain-containing protein
MGEGGVTRALLDIGQDVRDDRALAERICRACVDGLDIDGAAISVHTASTLRQTLYVSDPTSDLLEELQFTLGEGACTDAARTGRAVLVPDMGKVPESARWPVYAQAVVERGGVGAVFALPLQWATINLGVLDLHRKAAGSLPAAQLRDALGAADIAALMLLGLRTDPGEGRVWERSWGNRAEIHQATGMVLAQLGLSATDAFARLRAYAFVEHRLLIDVAHDVVARRLRFTEDT